MAALVLLLCTWTAARAEDAAHPLKPPDRSSPQATVQTFLDGCDAIAHFVVGEYMSKPTRAGFEQLHLLGRVPIECLDLSEVAPALRAKAGASAALALYEVLSRIELPPATAWPPVAAGDKVDGQRWTIPNTEISLVRSAAGEFRFSADTVARSQHFLDRVRDRPYLRPVPLEGISSFPVEAGGWLVPLTWIRNLPAWLRAPIAGEAVWKWIAVAIVLAVVAALLVVAFRISRRGSDAHPFLQAMRRLMLPATLLVLAPSFAFVAMVHINLVGAAAGTVLLATTAVAHIAGAWLCWRAAPVVAEGIIASPQIADQSVDAHLIRVFARLAGTFGSAAVLALGADRLGVPLYGVIAGLGVGGLALALAAQPTIENLIGGLSLFADKPIKVGDFGKYGPVTGTVEAIGIRSTRIRGTDRTITTIPNATLSKDSIVNLSQRDRLLIQTTIGLRYETTPDQLRFVLMRLHEMLLAQPCIAKSPVRVRFTGFNQSWLDVELFAYALTTDWDQFIAIREEVFLRVMDIVDEAGTSFAFPSQMEYSATDHGMDLAKTRAAEAVIRSKRDGGASAPADV